MSRMPWRIDPLFVKRTKTHVLYASKEPSAHQMTVISARLELSSRECWIGASKSVRCGWIGTRVDWVINLIPCLSLQVRIERPSLVKQREEYLAELRSEKQ